MMEDTNNANTNDKERARNVLDAAGTMLDIAKQQTELETLVISVNDLPNDDEVKLDITVDLKKGKFQS